MSYIDIRKNGDSIVCWERTADGELHVRKEPLENYLCLYMKDNTGSGTHQSIYGDRVKRVDFSDPRKLTEFAAARADTVFESDLSPVYQYLIDNFIDADTTAAYNIAFFDIEVDFDLEEGKGYPSPLNPFGEINSISMFDTSLSSYVMFIPSHLEGVVDLTDDRHGYPVNIVWCRSERTMLKEFAELLDDVDVISGWNSTSFDINYIMERAIIHFGEKKAKKMFCRNGIPATKREFVNEYGEDAWEWSLAGRAHLDMMLLFKKFHPGEKKSFKLDSICAEVLNEKKIEYDDDLGYLYRENPQRFFEYSLHDSRLLKMLDDKEKIIDLAMMMARDMCSLPKDVTGSVNIINMAIMKFCRKKDNIILPDMPHMDKGEFEGALVYDTISGRHTNVFTVDLAQLYPASIMVVGMSVENIVGQIEEEYVGYVDTMTNSDTMVSFVDEKTGATTQYKGSQLKKIIDDNGWCISGHGTVFDGTMGILAQFVKEGGEQRKKYKKLMKETDDERLAQRYDIYQKVMKIRNNSIYGCLSQPAFRLGDLRLSASTTATGRLISLWQAQQADRIVEGLISDEV